MDILSHNASITSGIDIESRDSLLYNTFFGMASSFESSLDLDTSISEFSEELVDISEHFIAIADAWNAAGIALSEELEGSQSILDNDLMVVIGGAASLLIVGAVIVMQRRRK